MMVAMALPLAVAAQIQIADSAAVDSTDIFYRHLNLKEVVVTGSTGDIRLADASVPVALLGQAEDSPGGKCPGGPVGHLRPNAAVPDCAGDLPGDPGWHDG